MSTLTAPNMGETARELVVGFLSRPGKPDRDRLSVRLDAEGMWFPWSTESILAVFFLARAERERVMEYVEKDWPPFPGLLVGRDQKPDGMRVAVAVGGVHNVFVSNHTSGLTAFEVDPRASFTIVNHFHEFTDPSGQQHGYTISLAFVLGLRQDERWSDIRRRLSGLLQHSVRVLGELDDL